MNFWDFLNKFGNSINRITSEKLSSPFWLPFITIWASIYWKSIYVTLLVDSGSLDGKTKLDYLIDNLPKKLINIERTFIGIDINFSLDNWITIFLGALLFYVFHRIVVKGIFGRLRNWSRGGYQEIKDKEKYLEKREELLEKERKIVEEEGELSSKRGDWDNKYEDIMNTKFGKYIDYFPEWFEDHGGDFRRIKNKIPNHALAYLKGENIVQQSKNNYFLYVLTDLGRYIQNKYLKIKYSNE